MPMRATTIRFAESIWGLLEKEAQAEGVSAAQFIRDATILRLGVVMAERGDAAELTDLGRLLGDAGAPRAQAEAPRDPVGEAVADPARLAALEGSGALDRAVRPQLDRVAQLAAEVLNAPVALVSLVESGRQSFAGCVGLPEPWASRRETPLSHSFCQHAVASRQPLVVSDAREHPVLHRNGAIRDLGVIAYAGVPLIDAVGHALGTLCVIDHRPRAWSRRELRVLEDLAASALAEIELYGARRQLERAAH